MITDPRALSFKYYTYAFLHLHLRYLKRCTEEIYKFRLPAATFALIGMKFLLEVLNSEFLHVVNLKDPSRIDRPSGLVAKF